MSKIRLPILYLFIVITFLIGCSGVNLPSRQAYRFTPAAEIPKVIEALPSYARFSISGLAFFHDKLFVSSNIGLIEIHGAIPAGVHKWKQSDDVVSGPWFDKANDTVWIEHDGIGRLFRLSGDDWQSEKIPEPEEGFSRGDMLAGFKGTAVNESFFLLAGGHIWRWNSTTKVFELIPLPEGVYADNAVPLDDALLLITRTSLKSLGLAGDPPNKLLLLDGLHEIPAKFRDSFAVDQVASVGTSAFVLTDKREVLRVTATGIEKISTPGVADAIGSAGDGKLIGNFPGLGIFEYDLSIWRKLYSSVYDVAPEDHWAYLAAADGAIALAYSPKPRLRGNDNFEYAGTTRLWVATSNDIQEVIFSDQRK
jgi:hypothetical protein